MEKDLLVSVIVPCYNVEKWVRECLESLLRQTYENIEIICVNDGSTDGTLDVIKSIAANDERCKVINKENKGYGHTINLGLEYAKGKYVAIVESDDYISDDMIKLLLFTAEDNNLDLVRAGYTKVYPEHDEKYVISDKDTSCVFAPVNVERSFSNSPISAALYRREFLKKNNIRCLETPGASYQDTSFNFKCNLMCQRALYLPDCLQFYRIHEMNSVRQSSGKIFCVCDEIEEIIHYARTANKLTPQVCSIIFHLLMRTYKWNFLRLRNVGRKQFLQRWSLDLKSYHTLGIAPSESTPFKMKLDRWILLKMPLLYFAKYYTR